MELEFDKEKSKSNQLKHGIDFVEAQALWQDKNRVVLNAKTTDELRYLLIAEHNRKLWTAVFTTRRERIRIISIRRSRDEEQRFYRISPGV